jgi:hypothetical protein
MEAADGEEAGPALTQGAMDARPGQIAAKRARPDSHVPSLRDELAELRALCSKQQQNIDHLRWREGLWRDIAQRAQPARKLACWAPYAPLGEMMEINCAAVASDGTKYICTESALFRTTPAGDVQLLGGHRTETGFVDGIGAAARLNDPNGIALYERGLYTFIFLADTRNHAIRIVNVYTRAIETLAGAGTRGFRDGVGQDAFFDEPWGIVMDKGTVFVTDSENNCIRSIDLGSKQVSTLTKCPAQEGSNDGPGGIARFMAPSGIALYETGCLCVSDTGYEANSDGGAVRMVIVNDDGVSCRVVSVSRHNEKATFSGSSTPWKSPQGIVVDSQKNILVADSHKIRLIRAVKNPQATRKDPDAFRSMQVSTLMKQLPKSACSLTLDRRGRIIIIGAGNHGELQMADTSLQWPFARVLYIGALKGCTYSSSVKAASGKEGCQDAASEPMRCLLALLPKSGKSGMGCPLLAYIIKMVIFCVRF